MTEHEEEAQPESGNPHGFIVVPSTVYNNNVLRIFESIANTRENVVVQLNKPFTTLKYELVYLSPPQTISRFDPFASQSSEIVWSHSYDTNFHEIRRSVDRKPFYGVPQQQVFFSEAEYEEHFATIKKNTEQIVDRMIENHKEEDEEGDY